MDDFQFIIESPQTNQSQRKRPRLVTSCDNCRLKKIKCLQASPDSKCDACSQAKVSCRFRDRERYFVERSQAIAGPGTTRSPFGDIQSTSTHDADRLPGSPHDELFNPLDDPSLNAFSMSFSSPSGGESSSLAHARNQTLPTDPTRSTKGRRHTQSQTALPTFDPVNDDPLHLGLNVRPSGSSNTFKVSNNALQMTGQQRLPAPLFDPSHTQSPHSKLMPHFIQKFVQHLGTQCPFVTYDYTLERFSNGNLPPLLANSIATLAVRYSDLPELVARGLDNVSGAYNEKAKSLLSTAVQIPSVETLHALMLLSWSEYKSGHIPPFRTYCELAMRMALDLGLSTDNAMRLNISERGRTQLRVTWSSVVQLNFFASTCV